MAAKKPQPTKMVVFTKMSGAKWGMFNFGGPGYTFVEAEVDATGPYTLGKGFYGYVVVAPTDGSVRIAEATTGALVGPSLKSVRKNVADCGDIKLMKSQVAAAGQKKRVRVSAEEFWSAFHDKDGGAG